MEKFKNELTEELKNKMSDKCDIVDDAALIIAGVLSFVTLALPFVYMLLG